jgi:hypothetical protein
VNAISVINRARTSAIPVAVRARLMAPHPSSR